MEMLLDKKQIQAIFWFEFKMGRKAAETACNIDYAFHPGTAKEHTVQWWFKFCKGDESLEVEAHSGWPLGVDNDNWEPSSKMILLQLHEKLRKNSTSTTLQLFSIWSKLESLRSSIIGCLMSWPEIKKKKNHFEMSSFLIQHNTMSHFWIRLWYVTKSRLCMTTGDDQLSCWTEKKLQSTSQSQTYTKRSWPLFGGLLLIHCWWSTTACWTPVKPSHLRSVLSKLTRCTENYACSQHWSTEGPDSPQQCPTPHWTTNTSKVEH